MSTDTDDTYEWSKNMAWAFEATVDARAFSTILDSTAALADECTIDISPDGISVRAVDPANVAAVDIDMDCVSSSEGCVRAGIDVSALVDDCPGYYHPGEYGITIDHGESDRIRVSNGPEGRTEAMAFDPDSTRNPPESWPEPDDGWGADVTLPAPVVRGLLGPMADVDADLIRLTADGDALSVESVTRDGDVRYSWGTPADIGTGGYAYYSADYVRSIARGLPADGDVRVRFGPEQVLDLDAGDVRYALANRVTPDFEAEDSA